MVDIVTIVLPTYVIIGASMWKTNQSKNNDLGKKSLVWKLTIDSLKNKPGIFGKIKVFFCKTAFIFFSNQWFIFLNHLVHRFKTLHRFFHMDVSTA